jgi:hypothetical protein
MAGQCHSRSVMQHAGLEGTSPSSNAAESLTSSVRVSGGPPLCGAAFLQVAEDRQG